MTDDVANLPLEKDFVDKDELLTILQKDSDGSITLQHVLPTLLS